MKPIELNSNCVFGANQEGVFPLPAYKNDNGDVYTTWELSQNERDEVMKTGRIYLIVQTFNRGFNPLIITTENPFIEAPKNTHVKIISVNGFSPAFRSLKVGSIHQILDPVEDKDKYEFADGGEDVEGSVWVMGDGEPVMLLKGEYDFIDTSVFNQICAFLVEIGFTHVVTETVNYYSRNNTNFTPEYLFKFDSLEEFKAKCFIVENS